MYLIMTSTKHDKLLVQQLHSHEEISQTLTTKSRTQENITLEETKLNFEKNVLSKELS